MNSDKLKKQSGAESGEPKCSAIKATKERVQSVLDEAREMTPKEEYLFGRLDEATQIPENERKKFKEIYFLLPIKLRKRYLGPLKYSLNDSNPVHVLTKFRAYLFELTRRELILAQELKPIAEHKHEPIFVEYLGYEVDQEDFDKSPHKPLGGNSFGDIESDIDGMTRNGKTYVYETKLMAIKIYGKEYGRHEAAKSRNQLLKYQAAIDKGVISGATIEVKGVIDSEFFDWIQRSDTVPDLEIIYCLDLPSGAEYRFVLKPGKGEGLKFERHNSDHNKDDLEIIRKIEAIQAGDTETLKACVAAVELSPESQNPKLTKEKIDRPYEIDSLEEYHAYQDLKLRGIWERFKTGGV